MKRVLPLVLLAFAIALPARAETVKLLGATRDRGVVVLALKAETPLSAAQSEVLLRGVIAQEQKSRPMAIYAYLYPHNSPKRTNPLKRQKDAVDAVFFMIRDAKALGWRWSLKYDRHREQHVFVDCTRPVRKCNINQVKPFRN